MNLTLWKVTIYFFVVNAKLEKKNNTICTLLMSISFYAFMSSFQK